MDPNLLQSLIGNLSHGFQSAAVIHDFQGSLHLPDDGRCTITAIGRDGKEHVVTVTASEPVDPDAPADKGYHAVVLLTHEIYFAKIDFTPDKKFMKLYDAHYLVPSSNGQRDLRLLRVGDELHAPTGAMTVNITYIISWQPLHDEGPIVRAISLTKYQ